MAAKAGRYFREKLADAGAPVLDPTDAGTIADIEASNLAATTITLSTSDTYTDAAVKSAVDTGLAGVTAKAETRFDALDAKVNAILAALRTQEVIDT